MTECVTSPGRGGRRCPAHIRDDQRAAIAEPQLRAVILAYPQPLGEPERIGEPGHRVADIGVDQYGNDGRIRDRTSFFFDQRAPAGRASLVLILVGKRCR